MNIISHGIWILVVAALTSVVFTWGSATVAVAQETQESCGWYWDYTFYSAGGWEWWCWSPQWGWWYGESEDGKKKIIAPKTTNAPLQFFTS
jgi:hypothetical protein